jgi:hypothetical protein
MRSTYLIAGAIVLALVAAGVLFGTDFFRKNPFAGELSPAEIMTQINDVAASGGVALTFAEKDAKQWSLAQGNRLERFSLDDSGTVFARLTSNGPLDTNSVDWKAVGLVAHLPLELNQRADGKKIEIGVAVRSPLANGSDSVAVVFATQQAGNSGWKKFRPSARFGLMTFTYDVPQVSGGYTNSPVVVFHSDGGAGGRSIEILGLYVRIMSSK